MRTSMLVLALLAACGEGGGEPAPSAPPEGAIDPDAMCEEHGVLLALCTKHNPALIPVFRARGNYCEEHGFPESICPVHHPERGGRPPGDVRLSADDGAPPHGTLVRFRSEGIARVAGIRTVAAGTRTEAATISAPARIVYDATRMALVNARTPGVIRELRADLGAQVEAGAPLAVVESGGMGADQARVRSARARLDL